LETEFYLKRFSQAELEMKSLAETAKDNRLPKMVIDYFKSFFKSQVITDSDNRLPFVVIDYLK